jgi:hypothetical protein
MLVLQALRPPENVRSTGMTLSDDEFENALSADQPERKSHFGKLVLAELKDLRQRVAELEQKVAGL